MRRMTDSRKNAIQIRTLLLKAADIETMPDEHKMHFLNPNAVRINKSLGDAVGLNHIGVHIIYVEPGRETTEYHKHHYEEECVYILADTACRPRDGHTVTASIARQSSQTRRGPSPLPLAATACVIYHRC